VIRRVPEGVRIGITGVGAHVPATVLDNDVVGARAGVDGEWIIERSGIRERRVAAPEMLVGGLALTAARRALDAAGIEAEKLDGLLVATATPTLAAPATAATVAAELGAARAAAYDLSAASTGFVYGLAQGHALIAAGLADRVLVIGAEILTRVTDWSDRATAILFGDGSGAVLLERVREGGFLGFELGCDGRHAADLTLAAGGTIKMNGPAVYRFSTREVPASIERLLKLCDLTVADVDVYAPHQSNLRIIEHTARKLGIPPEKVVLNIDRYGNTSAASIPLALADALADGRLHEGAIVLMAGVGAGLTWGSTLLRWGTSADGKPGSAGMA
jgi:3-oxoacyl-[acyl-carrier-protein] synthase III